VIDAIIYFGVGDDPGRWDGESIDEVVFPELPSVGDAVVIDFDVSHGRPASGWGGKIDGRIIRREWFSAPDSDTECDDAFGLVIYVEVEEDETVYSDDTPGTAAGTSEPEVKP
jgi:hypothetical protein